MGVRTNIVLDDDLINEVKQLTALKTKKDVAHKIRTQDPKIRDVGSYGAFILTLLM